MNIIFSGKKNNQFENTAEQCLEVIYINISKQIKESKIFIHNKKE